MEAGELAVCLDDRLLHGWHGASLGRRRASGEQPRHCGLPREPQGLRPKPVRPPHGANYWTVGPTAAADRRPSALEVLAPPVPLEQPLQRPQPQHAHLTAPGGLEASWRAVMESDTVLLRSSPTAVPEWRLRLEAAVAADSAADRQPKPVGRPPVAPQEAAAGRPAPRQGRLAEEAAAAAALAVIAAVRPPTRQRRQTPYEILQTPYGVPYGVQQTPVRLKPRPSPSLARTPSAHSEAALDVDRTLLANAVEYLGDNLLGGMALGAGISLAKHATAALPLATAAAFAACLLWVSVVAAASTLLHRLSTRLPHTALWGDEQAQLLPITIAMLARPVNAAVADQLCTAAERVLGPGAAATAAIAFAVVAGVAVTVGWSVVVARAEWSRSGQLQFAARLLQLYLLTLTGELAFMLWCGVAAAVAGDALAAHCQSHSVLTLLCALFWYATLRPAAMATEDAAVVDVVRFAVVFGWASDHCALVLDLCRTVAGYPAAAAGDAFPPAPAAAWGYVGGLFAFALLLAALQDDREFLSVSAPAPWAASTWTLSAFGFLVQALWASYQCRWSWLHQAAAAAAIVAAQMGLWVLVGSMRQAPEAVPATPHTGYGSFDADAFTARMPSRVGTPAVPMVVRPPPVTPWPHDAASLCQLRMTPFPPLVNLTPSVLARAVVTPDVSLALHPHEFFSGVSVEGFV